MTEECWLWARYIRPDGYGEWGHKLAHRRLYEILVGVIPEGLQIDHLCRVRHCVNPSHLEVVTLQVNVSRGEAGLRTGQLQRRKTHCPKGHPYSQENTYLYRGKRACKECSREFNRLSRGGK